MLSTLITIAVSLIGSSFDGTASLDYGSLLVPVKYAGLCLLPTFVTWSGHELSLQELIVRKALMLVLLLHQRLVVLMNYVKIRGCLMEMAV